jgi:hypothetical protein
MLSAMDDVLSGLGQQIIDGFKAALETSGAAMIGKGILLFCSLIGSWLYDTLGPMLSSFNIVTQRPEAWTNQLDIVRAGWQGMRLLAMVMLLALIGAHIAQWMTTEGAAAEKIASSMGALITAGVLVNLSLPILDSLMPAVNALLAWAADASSATTALPGWSTLSDVQAGSNDGIGKLVLALQAAWAFWHCMQGLAWWDVLIVTMPLAIAAGAWSFTEGWCTRWGTAMAGSLIAQFALCLALQISRVLLTKAQEAITGVDGSATQLSIALLLSIGTMAIVVKLAKMLHAGVDALHPFATAGRLRGTSRSGGAAPAQANTIVSTATTAATGNPAAGAAAGAASSGAHVAPIPPGITP